jgi:hypothetical protein
MAKAKCGRVFHKEDRSNRRERKSKTWVEGV